MRIDKIIERRNTESEIIKIAKAINERKKITLKELMEIFCRKTKQGDFYKEDKRNLVTDLMEMSIRRDISPGIPSDTTFTLTEGGRELIWTPEEDEAIEICADISQLENFKDSLKSLKEDIKTTKSDIKNKIKEYKKRYGNKIDIYIKKSKGLYFSRL